MNPLSRITIDPQVCGGRPCIRNMRIRVKDITAALTYAAHIIDHPVLSVA